MSRPLSVAVVGATGLVGEALLDLLARADPRPAVVHAVASADSAGRRVTFGERYLRVASLEDFDFAAVDLAVFAVPPATSARGCRLAAEAGALAVDLSGVWLADTSVPVWCPGLGRPDTDALREGRILSVVTGGAAVVADLLVALAPLSPRGLAITSLMPASAGGREAVEDLGRQSARLLGSQEAGERVFPVQAAFANLAAGVAGLGSGTVAPAQSLVAALHRLGLVPGGGVSSLASWTPAFFGQSLAVSLQCDVPVSAPVTRQLLEDAGFQVGNEDQPRDAVSMTADLPEDRARVASLAAEGSHGDGLACWIAFDNVRFGAALKGVQIVELLLKDYS